MKGILSKMFDGIGVSVNEAKEEIKEVVGERRKGKQKRLEVDILEILEMSINIQENLKDVLEDVMYYTGGEYCIEDGDVRILKYDITIDKKANIVVRRLYEVDEGVASYDMQIKGQKYSWKTHLIMGYKYEVDHRFERGFEFKREDAEDVVVFTKQELERLHKQYKMILVGITTRMGYLYDKDREYVSGYNKVVVDEERLRAFFNNF